MQLLINETLLKGQFPLVSRFQISKFSPLRAQPWLALRETWRRPHITRPVTILNPVLPCSGLVPPGKNGKICLPTQVFPPTGTA